MEEFVFGQQSEGGNMTNRYWAVIINGTVSGVFLAENEDIIGSTIGADGHQIVEVTHLGEFRPGPGWSVNEDGIFSPPDGKVEIPSPFGVPLPSAVDAEALG